MGVGPYGSWHLGISGGGKGGQSFSKYYSIICETWKDSKFLSGFSFTLRLSHLNRQTIGGGGFSQY